MFRRVFALIISSIFLSCIFCFAQTQINTLSCDQVISAPNMPAMKMKFYKKEGNSRMETFAPNGEEIVMIIKGGRMLVYYPAKRMAMEMPMSAESMAKYNQDVGSLGSNPDEFKHNLDKMKMFKKGVETVDGKLCGVYNFEAGGQGNSTVWMDENTGFPVKILAATPKGQATIEFKNVQINQPIDDKLFMVPAGTNIMDMSSMMQGIGQMMNSPEVRENMKKMMQQYKK